MKYVRNDKNVMLYFDQSNSILIGQIADIEAIIAECESVTKFFLPTNTLLVRPERFELPKRWLGLFERISGFLGGDSVLVRLPWVVAVG